MARGKDRESALEAVEAAEAVLRAGSRARLDRGIRRAVALSAQQEDAGTPPRRVAGRGDPQAQPRMAVRELPFREGLFEPFLEAVEKARSGPLLTIGGPARLGVRA